MKKYHIVLKMLDGESITILQSDDFDDLEEKLENLIINTKGGTFFPLSATRSSRFVNMDQIGEIRIEDKSGAVVYDVNSE